MSRWPIAWRDLFLLVLLGLLFQGIWAWRTTHPTYMDAYYYTTNGQRLAGGYGFSEQVIWQFLDAPDGLPTPSHSYWMPLTSLLAAAGYWLGDGFRGAQLPFWLLAGLLPLLAFVIGQQVGVTRWQAWVAALLTLTGGFYTRFFNQPSTFAPFAWLGGGCLLLLAWAGEDEKRPYLWGVAGLVAGLAHLTRADGVLLLVTGGVVLAWQRRGWRALGWLLAGYLLAMGGWFGHSWQTWGRPLSTVGTQTIFLTSYDDLFAYGRSFHWAHLLDWGWSNILRSRMQGVWVALQTFVAVNSLIFLLPFVLWGGVALWRRQRVWLRPLLVYGVGLYAAMSLIFTFPGQRGGLFHSSVALWPWLMVLASAGIQQAVDWVAARLPHWQPERAGRIFSGLFVAVALLLTLAVALGRADEDVETAVYQQFGALLPSDAVVMAGNAPGFYYHSGRAAVSVPNEPLPIVLDAAAAYGVDYLVLDANRPQPLADVYAQAQSAPSLTLLAVQDGYQLYEIADDQ